MTAPRVLLVIDLQNSLVEITPESGPRSNPELTENVPKILQAWRRLQWPIIHIVHHDSDTESPLNKDTNPHGHKPHTCAAPEEDEPVLLKTASSAFVHNDLKLARRLQEKGGDQPKVVIIGMDGAQCINGNARDGYDRGFDMYVVADACSTYGMPHYLPDHEPISAEDTHTAAMSMLANGFATVVTTKELLEQLPA